MTSENQIEQFEELLDNYSDGIASTEDMERLYLFISSDSKMQEEFCEHLIIEEALSQYHSEIRNGDNFVEAFKTRLHAERSSKQFIKNVETILDDYNKKGKKPVKIRKKSSANKKKTFHASKKVLGFRWFAYVASFIAVFGALFYIFKIKENQVKIKPIAKIDEVKGAVSLVRNGKSNKVVSGIPIFPEDQLLTETGTISFIYPDSTTIKILSKSKLSIDKGYKAKRLTLTYGKIEANVTKQNSYYPMSVISPISQITVVGTVFKFQSIDNISRLEVVKGKVRFVRLNDKKSLDVSGGEFAEIAKNVKFEIKKNSPDASSKIILTENFKNLASVKQNWDLNKGVFAVSCQDKLISKIIGVKTNKIGGVWLPAMTLTSKKSFSFPLKLNFMVKNFNDTKGALVVIAFIPEEEKYHHVLEDTHLSNNTLRIMSRGSKTFIFQKGEGANKEFSYTIPSGLKGVELNDWQVEVFQDKFIFMVNGKLVFEKALSFKSKYRIMLMSEVKANTARSRKGDFAEFSSLTLSDTKLP